MHNQQWNVDLVLSLAAGVSAVIDGQMQFLFIHISFLYFYDELTSLNCFHHVGLSLLLFLGTLCGFNMSSMTEKSPQESFCMHICTLCSLTCNHMSI